MNWSYTYKFVYVPMDLNALSESSKAILSDEFRIQLED